MSASTERHGVLGRWILDFGGFELPYEMCCGDELG